MNKNKLKQTTQSNRLTKTIKSENGYYVYRFLNQDNIVTYVGRTINLIMRFRQHDHLSNTVKKIEYISCKSYADMIWKEIYYINYFKNPLMTNDKDIFDGDVTELNFKEKWIEFNIQNKTPLWSKSESTYKGYEENVLFGMYQSIVINFNQNYNYRDLIHILEHEKMNSIGQNKYDLSHGWFIRNKNNLDTLRKHLSNFYRNIVDFEQVSSISMWTTYEDFFDSIKGKGFSKSYIHPLDHSFKEEYGKRFLLVYAHFLRISCYGKMI